MHSVNPGLIKKFSGLLQTLYRSKAEFEMVADEVDNHSLRTALDALSADSFFYAGELKNYLGSLGLHAKAVTEEREDAASVSAMETEEEGSELMRLCDKNEIKLISAYSELLHETVPFQELKELLRCQLNALKYNFMRVQALNSARLAAC